MIESILGDNNEFITFFLDMIISKIKEPDIQNKINNELIEPMIKKFIQNLYPYLLTAVIMMTMMFLSVLGLFILVLKK